MEIEQKIRLMMHKSRAIYWLLELPSTQRGILAISSIKVYSPDDFVESFASAKILPHSNVLIIQINYFISSRSRLFLNWWSSKVCRYKNETRWNCIIKAEDRQGLKQQGSFMKVICDLCSLKRWSMAMIPHHCRRQIDNSVFGFLSE